MEGEKKRNQFLEKEYRMSVLRAKRQKKWREEEKEWGEGVGRGGEVKREEERFVVVLLLLLLT